MSEEPDMDPAQAQVGLANATVVRAGDTVVFAFRRRLAMDELEQVTQDLRELLPDDVRIAIADQVESVLVAPARDTAPT